MRLNKLNKYTYVICLFLLLSGKLHAQCDTFHNADAANLVTNLYPYPTSFSGVDFVDIDGDGDKDFYFGAAFSSMRLYKNVGTALHPAFAPDTSKTQTTGFENAGLISHFESFQFVDIDGDGDYDCFISDYNYFRYPSLHLYYYKNIGDAHTPNFISDDIENPVPFSIYSSGTLNLYFTFADIDNDGDYDFTYQDTNGNDAVYRNIGSRTSPLFTFYSYIANNQFQNEGINYYDWNHDGLPDCFIGTKYYKNNGPLAAPTFTLDNADAPVFTNGTPYRFTNINADAAPEVYTIDGHLSTLAPVPVIDTAVQKIGNRNFIKYESATTSADYTYNWLFDNIPIKSYHKPFIYAEKRGNYTLDITSPCGTGISQPHYTYDRFAPGFFAGKEAETTLPSLLAPALVQAYPNPFTSEITVQIPVGSLNNVITITDLAGRVLLTQKVAAGTVKAGRSLPKGIYLLQILQGDNIIFHTTIMKQ